MERLTDRLIFVLLSQVSCHVVRDLGATTTEERKTSVLLDKVAVSDLEKLH